MRDLIRWDPFDEMKAYRHALDRFFDRLPHRESSAWSPSWDLSLDVAETDEAFVITASVPGVEPDDLEITVENSVLSIRGEIKESSEVEGGRYHLQERRYGAFSRSVSLPAPIDDEAIEATYKAGVLTVRLAKSETAKAKRIPVQPGNSVVIEG